MPKDKKRKRDAGNDKALKTGRHDADADNLKGEADVDTSKPSAVFRPTGGRSYTLTIALPGSIIANAKSHEQKTYLAGQIARALAVFCVDEVVIFDDEDAEVRRRRPAVAEHDYTAFSHPDHFLAHVLSYLETPPHLRRTLFPMHPNLRTAGTLPSLDMPHHLRTNEWCEYREGVALDPSPGRNGTLVDVGLSEPREIPDANIPRGTRITVELQNPTSKIATAVSPSTPREVKGFYWGYVVRQCSSLSDVFTECPFDGGYDISLGTSERGVPLPEVLARPDYSTPDALSFQHVLIVFGGVAGLEHAARNDPELQNMGFTGPNVKELFDCWVNVLPGQGSRTIRTEEAVWLGLMGLRGFIEKLGKSS
ncbi:hypothetical protein A1O3_02475 [Capronia epimyces CBS 606.96]|uniref:DUF171-domain-containing protein n=1 Tax=Capronia epimyces CBS 606.96 TaxID=1182542 RepID=W9YA91_9EURO|nr:uncharacterized protein A1O3_02475 [Capronia epimyces CBS 606.96]EXJ89408.1 hypothetical protein A1O3_02475 [Capronia epimyces CBS 606.96]